MTFKTKLVFPLIFLFAFCDIPSFHETTYSIYAYKGPTVIRVPGNYSTIQEAITAADLNAIILVADGVYNENIVINKPLSLISENGNSTIKSAFSSHVIKVIANNVNITGFIIENAPSPFAGIYVNGLHCNIVKNTLVNNYRGIYIYDSSALVLRENEMRNNTYNFAIWGREAGHFRHDIDKTNTINGKPIYYMVNKSDQAISVEASFIGIVECSNITARNLNLTGNEEGCLIAFSSGCLVENVTFSNNNRGVLLVSSHNNFFTGNYFSNNGWSGISLYNSKNNLLEKNVFLKENIGIFVSSSSVENIIAKSLFSNCDYGIWIQYSCKNSIFRNIIQGAYKGLTFEHATNNIVTNNYVRNNEYGFWLHNSADNTVSHNNFINNTFQAYISDVITCENKWNFVYPLGGNFWSDYQGEDADCDGIGDTQYIKGGVTDDLPLIAPIDSFEVSMFNVASSVDIISSSPIYGFYFNPEKAFLNFNLIVNGSAGFCRVTIPKNLLWAKDEQWIVRVDGELVDYKIIPDVNYTHLYFTYSSSASMVQIEGAGAVSEFSHTIIMFILAATLWSIMISCRRKSKLK